MDAAPGTAAARAAEQAARDSYGRLVAWLAWQWRDVAAAEDALADAFAAALATWPARGVPESPSSWLLTVAKRNLMQADRQSRLAGAPEVLALFDADGPVPEAPAVPDTRLNLLFVCAHPAIDAGVRTALMLQTVLGLDATRIAGAFLVSPATMAQRLVRAKAKIRASGLRFEAPEARELPGRLHAVLEAAYAAYGTGWDDVAGADSHRQGLAEEAIFLARLTARLLPEQPEALALLALLLFCEARRPARLDAEGRFVPLDEQDAARWSAPLLGEAEALLQAAARLGQLGPFQLEAAIQSAHAQRARGGAVRWAAVATLYEGLITLAPTLGAQVGHAAALARAGTPADALARLDALPERSVVAYQPYWALRAHLLAAQGAVEAARDAYRRAVGLTEDATVRAFLIGRERALPPG